MKALSESIVAEGLPTGDGPPAFEAKERDKDVPCVLVIATVMYLPEPSGVAVLPISGALVIRTALRAGIETVSLTVTVTVVVAVLSAPKALVEMAPEVECAFFRVITVAVVPPASRALLVGVALKARCVFLRVTVTAGVSRQLKGVAATSAASIKTAIIWEVFILTQLSRK